MAGEPALQGMKGLAILIDGVEGKQITEGEAEILFELAKEHGARGNIVEIGSFKGRSTICLALGMKAAKSGFRVYAVDPHITENTLPDFMANITRARVADVVVPINTESLKAPPETGSPISLLFIDGLHDYENVRADFEAWESKLIRGGVVALHDTGIYRGCAKVAQEKIFRSPRFKRVGWVGSNFTYGVKGPVEGTDAGVKAMKAIPWSLVMWKRRTRIIPGGARGGGKDG